MYMFHLFILPYLPLCMCFVILYPCIPNAPRKDSIREVQGARHEEAVPRPCDGGQAREYRAVRVGPIRVDPGDQLRLPLYPFTPTARC